MNTATIEKMNALFSDQAFFESNEPSDSFDALYDGVASKIPELSKDGFAEYMVVLGKAIEMREKPDGALSEEDLDYVSGGIGLTTLIVAGVVIGVCAWAGSKVGPWIGEALYYLANKKK